MLFVSAPLSMSPQYLIISFTDIIHCLPRFPQPWKSLKSVKNFLNFQGLENPCILLKSNKVLEKSENYICPTCDDLGLQQSWTRQSKYDQRHKVNILAGFIIADKNMMLAYSKRECIICLSVVKIIFTWELLTVKIIEAILYHYGPLSPPCHIIMNPYPHHVISLWTPFLTMSYHGVSIPPYPIHIPSSMSP